MSKRLAVLLTLLLPALPVAANPLAVPREPAAPSDAAISVEESDQAAAVTELATTYGVAGRIIFTADRDGERDLYCLNLADGVTRRLTAVDGPDQHPAVSPDGRRLAWVSNYGGQSDIWLAELGAEGIIQPVVKLTDTPAVEADLSWSQDGKRLYFAAEEPWLRDEWSSFYTDEEAALLPDRDTYWAVYYLDPTTGDVEPQSCEPGDHRCPVHFEGFGVICYRTAWNADSQPELVLIHDALAEDVIKIPGEPEELYGPITRRPPEPGNMVQFPFMQEGQYTVKSFSLDQLDTSTNKVLPTKLEAVSYSREPGGRPGGVRVVEDSSGNREIWLNLALTDTGERLDRQLSFNRLAEQELVWAPVPVE